MLGIDLVHGLEVADVGEVDVDLHHILEIEIGCLQHGAQVGEDLPGLGRDIAVDHLPRAVIDRDLAGEIDEAGRRDRMRVRAAGFQLGAMMP